MKGEATGQLTGGKRQSHVHFSKLPLAAEPEPDRAEMSNQEKVVAKTSTDISPRQFRKPQQTNPTRSELRKAHQINCLPKYNLV